MNEASDKDLLKAVKESLRKDGRLDQFKSEIRSSIMSILRRPLSAETNVNSIPKETRLINNLLREYLAWNGYVFSELILVAESSLEKERLPRDVIATMLGVTDDPHTLKLPLLYYIVSAYQNREQT